MSRSGVALLLALVLAGVETTLAQSPNGVRNPEPDQEAQGRLIQRLLDHATAELNLSADQRARLQEVLVETMERRQELERHQGQLAHEIQRALSDPTSGEEEFRRLADEKVAVGRQNVELGEWQQARLAEFLTSRQLLRFMLMQERLAQRIQEMRRNRRRQ